MGLIEALLNKMAKKDVMHIVTKHGAGIDMQFIWIYDWSYYYHKTFFKMNLICNTQNGKSVHDIYKVT